MNNKNVIKNTTYKNRNDIIGNRLKKCQYIKADKTPPNNSTIKY